MIKRYLVFDVGCIECGEPSGVVGTYETREEAIAAAELERDVQLDNWTGQHHFEVHDLGDPQPEESHPEWEACR